MPENKADVEQARKEGTLVGDHHHAVTLNKVIAEQYRRDERNFSAGMAIASIGTLVGLAAPAVIEDKETLFLTSGGALLATGLGAGAMGASVNGKRRRPTDIPELEGRMRKEGIHPPIEQDHRYLGNGWTAQPPIGDRKEWVLGLTKDDKDKGPSRG